MFVFLKGIEWWDLSKTDFKECWQNYISSFFLSSFSSSRLICGISDWDNGSGKQCCKGSKKIKHNSKAAERKWGKWCTKDPGPQNMVRKEEVKKLEAQG